MQAKREVFVKVIGRAENGKEIVKYYDAVFGEIKKNAQSTAKEISDALKKIQGYSTQGTGTVKTTTTNARGGSDPMMRQAEADIKRFQQMRSQMESAHTRLVEQQADKQYRAKVNSFERGLKEFQRILHQEEKAAAQSAKNTQSAYSSAFSGGFFGSLAGSLVDNFTSVLSQIPARVSQYLDDAIKISQEKQNALMGLQSIAAFKGVDAKEAEEAIKNLRLVRAGIISVGEASTGMKNLLATNFTLDESTTLLERFSDSAAFGKQQALGFGEAVRSSTEGLKNGNSILLDNAGVTKNLSVILKEHGKSQNDVMNITSDASVRQAVYKGLLKETAGQVGDADKLTQGYTGSVAGLDQAYKNLSTSVGDYITKNPDIIAANQIQTEQVKTLTSGLTEQGTETQKVANDWMNYYAKIKAGMLPFLASIQNSIKALFHAVAGIAGGVFTVVSGVIETVVNGVRWGIGSLINFAIDGTNKAIELAKNLPDSVKSTVPGIGNLAQSAPMERYDTSFDYSVTKSIFAGMKKEFDIASKAAGATTQSVREMRAAFGDVDTYSQDIANRQKELADKLKNPAKRKNDDADSKSSGGKTKKAPMSYEERTYRDIAKFAEEQGFNPGSGYRKNSKAHAAGIAHDIRLQGKSPEQIAQFIVAALEKGYRVLDERTNIFNSPKWTGSHLHLEASRSGKPSVFNPSGNYGGIPIGMLKELDTKRGGKTGASQQDIESYIGRESDEKTKAERNRKIQELYGLYQKLGWTPGAFLDDFTKLLVEKARKGEDVGLGKGVQPEQADVNEIFRKNALGSLREAETSGTLSGSFIDQRRTPGGNYLKQFRQSLGLDERYSETENDVEVFYDEATLREEQFAGIVQANFDARKKAQDTSVFNARVEWDLVQRRNVAEEAGVVFAESRNAQANEFKDIERDLLVLRRQSTDSQFSEQRRLLAARREEYDLQKQIIDLQDRLANGGVNDGLRIQTALLNDILDLRNREVGAIISANRSQLELSQSMRISNNEIRAGVTSHLASQETLSQSIASGINQTYDALSGKLTETLDRLNEKTKGFLSFIIEPAKAIQKNALTNITKGLLDSFFPGVSSSMERAENPLLAESKDQTKLLQQIAVNTGGASLPGVSIPGVNGGAGGGMHSIWSQISSGRGILGAMLGGGGNLGNRSGINSPMIFNANGGGGSFSVSDFFGGYDGSKQGGGGIMGNLKSMFGKEGGYWGKEGFGWNSGTVSGMGSIAQMAGSMIGGRWGNVLSYGGTGAQIGSMFGGPIGGAVGAGLGALIGLFKGDGKEKEDKKNFPEFQKGFAEAISQMQAILTDLQKPRVTVDVDSAVKQAEDIRKQIQNTNVGQLFQSSKYRKQGQSQIKSYLSQADTVLSQINAAAGAARTKQERRDAASELYSRILPEFADGGAVSRFAEFNNLFSGRVPGAYDRRDDKLIRVSGDEVVLTPKHWRPITPYLAQAKVPGFADGGFTGSYPAAASVAPIVNVQMGNIILEGFTAAPDAKAYLETPDGKRSVISIVEDGYANGKVRLQKR